MKDGGPAFPRAGCEWTEDQGDGSFAQDGMSLRDWFAGQALVGLLASIQPNETAKNHGAIARVLYDIADAMVAEKRKRE